MTSKHNASAKTLFWAGALFVFSALASAQVTLDAAPHDAQRFGELPAFELTERSGRVLTRDDLLGAPWIATLFFTSCSGPCPRLSADIRRLLHDQLAGTDVRIVSISVDPETDTPQVLEQYADAYTADPERWLFLTGPEAEVFSLVRDGLKLPVEKPDAADFELTPAGEALQVTHATRLVAIDAAGQIAGFYECGGENRLSDETIEANFAKLVARVRALDGRAGSRSRLPLFNACCNGLAALLLILGLIAIKRDRRGLHAALMRSAFVASAVFLAGYLYYHFVVLPLSGGPTRYNAGGWRKAGYLLLLLSHVVLAMINLPMVLLTLWRAHKGDWERHKRLARKTFPIWLYVSVTGVLVYMILYHWNPAPL